ncbi:MAG: PqqD family protein [Clostridia bacterium]|nr:PqqD family protein [Clostridia bacterium]
MKIKAGYMLRQVMDVYLVLGVGSEAYVPNQIMTLNETGAFLWEILEKGAEKQDLVDALLREYDTDAETAGKDVDAFLAQLWEKALIEG